MAELRVKVLARGIGWIHHFAGGGIQHVEHAIRVAGNIGWQPVSEPARRCGRRIFQAVAHLDQARVGAIICPHAVGIIAVNPGFRPRGEQHEPADSRKQEQGEQCHYQRRTALLFFCFGQDHHQWDNLAVPDNDVRMEPPLAGSGTFVSNVRFTFTVLIDPRSVTWLPFWS